METVLLKSFSIEGINEGELRKFTAWGSVEVKDRHDETIPIQEVYKIMDIWMSRDAPIMFNHTSQKVGKGLSWQPKEKNGKPGVLITGIVHKNYTEDDKIWNDMKNGKFEGLSIGGKAKRVTKNGETFLENLIGYEFSIVERTGNQEATFVDLNVMAKNNTKMVDEVKKQEEDVSTETPEVTMEDRVAGLEEMMAAQADKLNELIEAIAGAPEDAEKQEEEPKEEAEKAEEEMPEAEKQEDEEEAEKQEDEEEDEVSKNLKTLADKVSSLEKQLADKKVVEVVKTERPAVKEVKEEEYTFTDVMKGKVSLDKFTGAQ